MPGVGEQRDRMAENPIDRFDDHKASVEGRPNREGGPEMSGRVRMAMAGMIMMIVIVTVIVMVIVSVTHVLASASERM